MTDWWSSSPPATEPTASVTVRPSDADKWWESSPEVGYTEDVVRSVDAGLARGMAGIGGLPGQIGEYGAQGINALAQLIGKYTGVNVPPRQPSPQRLPDIGEATKRIEGKFGKLYEPKTTPGSYAGTVAEFLPGAVLGPGGMARNVAAFGVAPGLASEGAGQATKGTGAEPYARAAGALAGGGAGALLTRPTGTARAIRQELPEGVTPQMVDQAQDLIEDAAQRGIALSWPEALSQVAGRPVLTDTMRHLEAAAPAAGRMADFLGSRPGDVRQAARAQFDQVTPPTTAPSMIGPEVGRAADQVIGDVRGIINQRTDPLYQASEAIRLTPQEMAQARALPGFREARDAVRNTPQLNRYVAHLPDDSVGFLNEVKKYMDQRQQNTTAAFNPDRNAQIGAGYGQDAASARQIGINAAGRATAPGANPYEAALLVQEQMRRQYLEPLLQGPIGKLAQKDITTQRAIAALFPSSPLPNSAQEIETAVRALVQRNPEAARQLVRAHMEMTFNEATRDLHSGARASGGANFRAKIFGNPQQAANLEAAVRALPNGGQIWPGIQRFFDVLEATGTRQNIGSKTAYNVEFLKAQSASGLIGETTKATAKPVEFLKFLADRYERWQLGQNLDELARVFTNPRAANQLRAIARMPVQSNAALQTVARTVQLSLPSVEDQVNKSRK